MMLIKYKNCFTASPTFIDKSIHKMYIRGCNSDFQIAGCPGPTLLTFGARSFSAVRGCPVYRREV